MTASPPTVNGTTIAAALIAVVGSVTYVTVRAVLRRRPHDREPAERGGDGREAPDPATTRDEPEVAIPTSVRRSTPSHTAGPSTAPSVEAGHHDRPGDAGSRTSFDQPGGSAGTVSGKTNSYRVTLFDRRLTERVPFESTARIQWDDHDVAGTTIDLSMSGVGCRLSSGLLMSAAPHVGTTVRVTLLLNGALGVFRARVQWVRLHGDAPGVGLMFLQLQDTHRAMLEPVILQAA